MLSNFIRAKVTTHTLTVALGALAFAAHHFFSDPHAAAWLAAHWVFRDVYESVGATLVGYGVYKSPVAPMA